MTSCQIDLPSDGLSVEIIDQLRRIVVRHLRDSLLFAFVNGVRTNIARLVVAVPL